VCVCFHLCVSICVFPFVQSLLCEEGLEKVSHYVNLVIKYVKVQVDLTVVWPK
jgi:hypothetical protein